MENNKSSKCNSHNKGRFAFGAVLVLVGCLFLLFNFGIIPSELKSVLFSWQMLLIVVGLGHLFCLKLRSACIWLAIGGFFLMPRLIKVYPDLFPNLSPDFVSIYWPVLLIIAGIFVILEIMFHPKREKHAFWSETSGRWYGKRSTERIRTDSSFEKNVVFGIGEYIVLEPEFKGGEINSVFGGTNLDLRKTTLPEGDTILEVNAVFGGVVITVPQDWLIEIKVDAVFGGVNDTQLSNENTDNSRKLIITGACVFGGLELKN